MVTIRIAEPADAPALAALYKPYVETPNVSLSSTIFPASGMASSRSHLETD